MQGFKFELRAPVVIAASGERGEVIGRADYVTAMSSYLVRYRRADGNASECWWSEDALVAG